MRRITFTNGFTFGLHKTSARSWMVVAQGEVQIRVPLADADMEALAKMLTDSHQGRCPRCAHEDADMASAFCELHRDRYHLAQASDLGTT